MTHAPKTLGQNEHAVGKCQLFLHVIAVIAGMVWSLLAKKAENSSKDSPNTTDQAKNVPRDPSKYSVFNCVLLWWKTHGKICRSETAPAGKEITIKQQPLPPTAPGDEKPRRVPDFTVEKKASERRARRTMKNGQPCTTSTYSHPAYTKNETNSGEQSIPTIDLKRYKDSFHSIPLFLFKNVHQAEIMVNEANQLAWVLMNLARHVFGIPIETIHLYQDVDEGKDR
jgi:hypothetical protein